LDVKPGRRLADKALEAVLAWLDGLGSLVLLTGRALLAFVRPPFRTRLLLTAMDDVGVQSLFIVALTGVFSGMVVALQTAYALRVYGAEGSLGGITALSLAREVAPVFTAIVVTARAGSSMAAELGNMRITDQIDAITTMGVSAVQYLVTPRIVAAVVTVPILTALYGAVALLGAYFIGVVNLGGDRGVFLQSVRDFVEPRDLSMGLLKAVTFGLLFSAISCRHGFFAEGGARGVGAATTRSVVESCVAVLLANYVITQALLGASGPMHRVAGH
jgi:phospholipid/cholesterol/gamma-HCH transport system permease protein